MRLALCAHEIKTQPEHVCTLTLLTGAAVSLQDLAGRQRPATAALADPLGPLAAHLCLPRHELPHYPSPAVIQHRIACLAVALTAGRCTSRLALTAPRGPRGTTGRSFRGEGTTKWSQEAHTGRKGVPVRMTTRARRAPAAAPASQVHRGAACAWWGAWMGGRWMMGGRVVQHSMRAKIRALCRNPEPWRRCRATPGAALPRHPRCSANTATDAQARGLPWQQRAGRLHSQ